MEERFKKIIGSLDFLYANKAELTAYDKILDDERSFASQIDTAAKEGEEVGELKKAMQVAERMLGRFDVNEIIALTGLTIEQVEELKNNKK